MEMILTLATSLRFWLGMGIACLTLFGTVQTWRLNEARDDLDKIRLMTTIAREQSDNTIEKLRESIPVMVSQAQGNAVANYKKRFGVACGVRASGLLPNAGSGEAGFPERNNELHKPEPVACDESTLETAATDAVIIEAVKTWARENNLKVK
jgi:hypothetical protein